jgi:hypothetical protein
MNYLHYTISDRNQSALMNDSVIKIILNQSYNFFECLSVAVFICMWYSVILLGVWCLTLWYSMPVSLTYQHNTVWCPTFWYSMLVSLTYQHSTVWCPTFWYSMPVSLTYQHNTVFLNTEDFLLFSADSVSFSQNHSFNILCTYLMVIIHSTCSADIM